MTETDLGRVVTLSTTQRNHEMEERFNIFPGRIYGVRISGMNPQMSIGYAGALQSITMHIDRRGFDPRRVELRDGLMDDRTPFERESISLMNCRLLDFGYVEDEGEFRRRRGSHLYSNNGGRD